MQRGRTLSGCYGSSNASLASSVHCGPSIANAGVLSFLRHVDNETLIEPVTAYSAEIIPLIRNHTLFSEWNDFVARLAALGVPVENKRHPLEAVEAGAERRSAAPPVDVL